MNFKALFGRAPKEPETMNFKALFGRAPKEPETWREFLAYLASTKEAKELGLRLRIMDVGGDEFTPENFLNLYRAAVALPLARGFYKAEQVLQREHEFQHEIYKKAKQDAREAQVKVAKLAEIIAARAAKEVGLHLAGEDVIYVDYLTSPNDKVEGITNTLMGWFTALKGKRHILAVSRPATREEWTEFLRAWVKEHGWRTLDERNYPMGYNPIIVPTQDCWVEPRHGARSQEVLVPRGINVRIVDIPGHNKFYYLNEDGTTTTVPEGVSPPLFSDIDLREVI